MTRTDPDPPRRPRIGVALGSGGARGWAHLGVLAALAERGIRPDIVTGASMGALVGAAAAGDRLDALEAWCRRLQNATVLRYIDMRIAGGGLVAGQEVARMLRKIGLPDRIEDLPLPFGAVATDLETGAEVALTRGPIAGAVRSSLAIPGVFSPHWHDGRWLLDGALCDPVPVRLARALGAEVVIAIDPNASCGKPLWHAQTPEAPGQTLLSRVGMAEVLPKAWRGMLPGAEDGAEAEDASTAPSSQPPGYFQVVSTAIDIMQVHILRQRLAQNPPDLLLEADLKHVGILELHRAPEAMEHGRALVDRHATALDRLCLRPAAPV
ncbi:patatin [Meridianimarinicoccus roseus]|uniref:Patatin n=1 Tax=Meridianimarinicoccus roseus TaxID=2072018 RepID=A0A2V2LER7_9RHOB|nr:patatin-like phospholipase family protein [Meridianimarinicoccus roseus]PWR01697.1 patatin [Meridianimarinicoccus roseus]